MRPILTATETQELDRRTEERGIAIAQLMERAGMGVAGAAVRVAGGAYGRRLVGVCGGGNNGGDALVAARLAAAQGMRAVAVLVADPGGLREPAAMNLRRLARAGVPCVGSEGLGRELARADVVVDGLFGSGFRGEPEGRYREAIGEMNASGAPIVAVDIPSGVEGDTGVVRGPAVRAVATVTFGAPKVGVVLYPGAELAGRVEIVDIGFPEDLLTSDLQLVEPADVRRLLPVRGPDAHKHRSGDVLVVAGSRRMTGAPRLVADGASRAGAGLVTIAVPQGILSAVQAGAPEAVYLPLPDGSAGSVTSEAWDVLAERLDRFDAVAVGPGLSTDQETPAFVRRLVRESPVPVVADADAITAFAGLVPELRDRAGELVLTPHAGEFGRLFGMPPDDLADDRIGAVRKAAAETGAVVLLKGPRTLVALPDGTVRVNPTGSPALATGGTGDVLTGAIAAYVARGLSPHDAATAAAFVHGRAGEAVGARLGDGGVASDVALAIPAAAAAILEESA